MRHSRKVTKLLTGATFVFLLTFSLVQEARAEDFIVDRLTDAGEGKGFRGDLRYCIVQANRLPGDDNTITFEITGTIDLTGALPNLRTNIDIQGPVAELLTVRRSTSGIYRIFTVDSGATVLISALAVSNGLVTFQRGAGIYNSGTLTVSNATVSGNESHIGGGIYNSGTLTIIDSRVFGNHAWGYFSTAAGGGIYNEGTLTINGSTIARNDAFGHDPEMGYADGFGGGIANLGTLTVSNSSIWGNDAAGDDQPGKGGGIYNSGDLMIGNSSVSGNGNNVSLGGGIYNSGSLVINNSTISNNRAFLEGGGILNTDPGILNMRNTILAGNTFTYWGGPDLSGSLASSGYNLIGNTSRGSGFDKTDLLNVDPLLGPLQDNGGPTWTHALAEGSPAIDAGDNTDAPEWDQRGEGFPRIVNDVIDIGAFEEGAGVWAVAFTVPPHQEPIVYGSARRD